MSILFLKEKLQKDNFNFKKIKKILIQTNSFIAGSYIVQSLLQEDWYEKDIDIYTIPKHEYNHIMEPILYNYFIKELGYKIHNIDIPNNLSNDNNYIDNLSIVNKYREDLFITDDTEKIINIKHSDSINYPNINLIILKSSKEDEEDNECKMEKKVSKKEKERNKIKKEEKDIEKIKKVLIEFDLTNSAGAYYPSISEEQIIWFDTDSKSDCINKTINIRNHYGEKNKNIFKWFNTLRKIFKYMRRGFEIKKRQDVKECIKKLLLENSTIQSYFIDNWNQIIFQNYDINVNNEENEEYYIIPIIKQNLEWSYDNHEFIQEIHRLQDMKKHIRINYKVDEKVKYTPCHIDIIKDIDEKEQDIKEESNTENKNKYKTFDMLMASKIYKKEVLEDPDNDNIIIGHIDQDILSVSMGLSDIHSGFFSNDLDYNIDKFNENHLDKIIFNCLKATYKGKLYTATNLFDPYIKINYNVEEGMYGLSKFGIVKLDSFLEIYKTKNRIFYLTPCTNKKGTQNELQYTCSYKNSTGNEVFNDGVSANHCQAGTNEKIFTIGICDKSECKLTKNSYISEEELKNRKQICMLTENFNKDDIYGSGDDGKDNIRSDSDRYFSDDDSSSDYHINRRLSYSEDIYDDSGDDEKGDRRNPSYENDNDLDFFFDIEYNTIPGDYDLENYLQNGRNNTINRTAIYQYMIKKAINKLLLSNQYRSIHNDNVIDIDYSFLINAEIGTDILTALYAIKSTGEIISKNKIEMVVDLKIYEFSQR
jgi:hypothetical protein